MRNEIFLGLDSFFLAYFLWLNIFYLFLLFLTNPELIRRFREIKAKQLYSLLPLDVTPPLSLIITAYNERETVAAALAAAFQVKLPHCQIILVDDGSTDSTLPFLIETFQLVPVPPAMPISLQTAPVKQYFRSKLHPNFLVIHKENGGREDAINAGINACTAPFFVGIDSDSLIEPDALDRLMEHLLTQRHICAMGGTLCIANGCTIEKGSIKEVHLPNSFFGKMQVLEYLRTFFFGRLGWNQFKGSFLISGGFGLFKKQTVVEAGGLKPVLAGDLDLTVRLHKMMHDKKMPYRIDYVFDAIVWTDVPQTYSALANQRKRWHSSIIDVCWRYKHMMFNPKYGLVGFFHIPYLFLGEGLSPLVEGLGYLYILFCYLYGSLSLPFFWYFLLIAWGISLFLTLTSLIMQQVFLQKYMSPKQILGMTFLAFIENFGYRQLSVWWRIQGFFRYFTKKRFFREEIHRSLSIES